MDPATHNAPKPADAPLPGQAPSPSAVAPQPVNPATRLNETARLAGARSDALPAAVVDPGSQPTAKPSTVVYFAQRDLHIDGATIKSGQQVATLEMSVGVQPDRLIASIQAGAIGIGKPGEA